MAKRLAPNLKSKCEFSSTICHRTLHRFSQKLYLLKSIYVSPTNLQQRLPFILHYAIYVVYFVKLDDEHHEFQECVIFFQLGDHFVPFTNLLSSGVVQMESGIDLNICFTSSGIVRGINRTSLWRVSSSSHINITVTVKVIITIVTIDIRIWFVIIAIVILTTVGTIIIIVTKVV